MFLVVAFRFHVDCNVMNNDECTHVGYFSKNRNVPLQRTKQFLASASFE
jgi:hypothetical protein